MIRLFNRDINLNNLQPALQTLLVSVATLQTHISNLQNVYPPIVIQENDAHQIISLIHDVASKLNMTNIDWGQKIVIDCFNNTPVDIMIHTLSDNHRLMKNPHVRNIVLMWERHVISPIVIHLASVKRLDILNNKTLIGDAQVMDTWSKFEGTKDRGMFNTIGSMLAKGYFKALVQVCDTPYLPSSFVGNLVGWGLHAEDPETRDDIYLLLSVIHSLPHYVPSSGVVEQILSYEPGLVKRPTIDIISDFTLDRHSDLRDIDVPNDVAWQTCLLNLAKHLVATKMHIALK
jgi:hypothetical protein